MSTSPYISEVNQKEFAAQVLEKSREVPVLVDFWAEWCQPCHMLMPTLAKLANVYAGKFLLAKVNTDSERELAMTYGIRSLPTVKIFRNGEVADEFMGVQPESIIRQIIDRHVTRESDTLVEAALLAHREEKTEKAIALLQKAMDGDSDNDRIKIELTKIYLERGRFDDAENLLNRITKLDSEGIALVARIEFARIAADALPASELQQAISSDPNNCDARLKLSALQVSENDYESALQQLLEIVKRNRKFGDDAGRRYMVALFNMLGSSNDLVSKYRNLLSMALN
jgi:putative thioredoxin